MPNFGVRARRDEGFTLIETLVAMVVLLVGVLGTATMALAAMQTGQTTRGREAATNLAREVVESARSVTYGSLLTTTAPAALQAMEGLADADTAASGWQVNRRGVSYTVTVTACIYDDPKDGNFSGNTGAGYCPGLTVGAGDSNGDDHRKLVVTVRWGTRQVPLTATVANPAGGFGPRITSLSSSPMLGSDAVVLADAGTTEVSMTVGTTQAASLSWNAGDTKNGGQLTSASGATSWRSDWALGTPASPASFTCATAIDWVPDAPAYQTTFQPFDASGVPGDLRTQTVAVDRSLPYPVCDFAGGRNPQHQGVIDLQWRASFEGDVVSYSVWRRKLGTETIDRLVCDAVRTTECVDTSPPHPDSAAVYYVKPKQNNLALGSAFGTETALEIPVPTTPNEVPTAPGAVSATAGSQPTVSWTPSSDADGTVILYRIYRDGHAIADRYGKTSNGTTLAFTDKAAGDTTHSYYVSAVDDAFAESVLVPAS